jgi:hypothetical protein
MIAQMKRAFEKRWGLLAHGCCLRGGETSEERLERKVRMDVKQAYLWDQQLTGCEGDEREMRLIELARFEQLSSIEQARIKRSIDSHLMIDRFAS